MQKDNFQSRDWVTVNRGVQWTIHYDIVCVALTYTKKPVVATRLHSLSDALVVDAVSERDYELDCR